MRGVGITGLLEGFQPTRPYSYTSILRPAWSNDQVIRLLGSFLHGWTMRVKVSGELSSLRPVNGGALVKAKQLNNSEKT